MRRNKSSRIKAFSLDGYAQWQHWQSPENPLKLSDPSTCVHMCMSSQTLRQVHIPLYTMILTVRCTRFKGAEKEANEKGKEQGMGR